MNATAEIKLNLGARKTRIPGFLNLDCDPHPGVDVVGDVSKLPYQDGCVSEIYASQILEHFPHTQTLDVLKEWFRVLRPSGILYVGVPDFWRAVEIAQKCGLADWVVNQLWGDQNYKTAFHYAGFDEVRLSGLLKKAGFSEVSRVDSFPYGCEFGKEDCSHIVSSYDNKKVSLNMVAIR